MSDENLQTKFAPVTESTIETVGHQPNKILGPLMYSVGKFIATIAVMLAVSCSPFIGASAASVPTPTSAPIMIQHFSVPDGTLAVQAGDGTMGINIVNGVPAVNTFTYIQGDLVWGEVTVQCNSTNSSHTTGATLSFGAVSSFARVSSVSNGTTTYSLKSMPGGAVNQDNTWSGSEICINLKTLSTKSNE